MVLLRLLALFVLLGPAAALANLSRDHRVLALDLRGHGHSDGRALLMSDAEFAAVRVPTLALVGAADPALPHERGLPRRPEFGQAIRRWIAN